MEYVFLWANLSAIAGYFAVTKGRNGAGWFLLALLISPLLAIIVIALLSDLKKEASEQAARSIKAGQPKTKPCPSCAEPVMVAALRCKHCGADIPPEPIIEETTEDKVKRYGIYRDAGQYIYGKYRYNSVDDAIADAEKENGVA